MKSPVPIAIVIAVLCTSCSGERPPERVARVKIREQVDTVGYAVRPEQVELVAALADSLIVEGLPHEHSSAPVKGGEMIGAIVPHDDYIFAAPYYVMTLGNVRAPLVIVFGVAHRARRIGLEGKLIFDDFSGWRGPYGVNPVSPLRERVIAGLPAEIVLVDGAFHAAEHSIEAIIPFLQYPVFRERMTGAGAGEVEILPVLVTRFSGDSFEWAAGEMARVLSRVLAEAGMRLGRDVAVLISADCVHYGDENWGGRGYAPFGTGPEGYAEATGRDIDIARATLEGSVSAEKIAGFRDRVECDDLEWPYKVTWCGVYSIPFGLTVLHRLASEQRRAPPSGILLGYGTSLQPGRLPVEWTGLGATNIATMRHWVGYLAMGYW
jgi:AmmeMemoRadiSam system protein B